VSIRDKGENALLESQEHRKSNRNSY